MAYAEHPKSTVNRLIAQGKIVGLKILEPTYSHRHQNIGNKNFFTCSIRYSFNGDEQCIDTEEFLVKKDCERNAYEQLLKRVQQSVLSDTHTKSENNTVPEAKTVEQDVSIQKSSVNVVKDLLMETGTADDIIYVIIDLENIAKVDTNAIMSSIYSTSKNESKVLKIIKVAGFCSSVKDSADIVVRSNRKDAVDHYISYLIGLIEFNSVRTESAKPPEIYIITRDKFGSCLQDFCLNVVHCSDVRDFCERIKHF